MQYHGRINVDVQSEFLANIESFPEPLRFMCLNIWATGIRVSEVCMIVGGDYSFDGEEAWLRVTEHKYSRIRAIPIPFCLYELMNGYIVRNGIKADEYVFKDEKGQAYDANAFRKQLQLLNASQRNGYIFKPHECRQRLFAETLIYGDSIDTGREFPECKNTENA